MFLFKGPIPAQKFLNQKQWLTVKLQIKEIKLNVPIAFADLGFGFISLFFFTSLKLIEELPSAQFPTWLWRETCNAQNDIGVTVSQNHVTVMTGNLKLTYLASGWETAVDPDLLNCWGISRAKETMVQKARRGFCQWIPLWIDSSCFSYSWKVIAVTSLMQP